MVPRANQVHQTVGGVRWVRQLVELGVSDAIRVKCVKR